MRTIKYTQVIILASLCFAFAFSMARAQVISASIKEGQLPDKMVVGETQDLWIASNLVSVKEGSGLGLYFEDVYSGTQGLVSWINNISPEGKVTFLLPKVSSVNGIATPIATSRYKLVLKYFENCSGVCDNSKLVSQSTTVKSVFVNGQDGVSFLVRPVSVKTAGLNVPYFGVVGAFGDFSAPLAWKIEGLPVGLSFQQLNINVEGSLDKHCTGGSCKDFVKNFVVIKGTPTQEGSFDITATATDTQSKLGTYKFKLVVSKDVVSSDYIVKGGWKVIMSPQTGTYYLVRNGQKVLLPNAAAMKSYGIDKTKVPTVTFEELVTIDDLQFMRLKTSRTIYTIQDGKRRVLYPAAIRRLGANLANAPELYWNHFWAFADGGGVR